MMTSPFSEILLNEIPVCTDVEVAPVLPYRPDTLIHLWGDRSLLFTASDERPRIAIIGTRQPTELGRRVARVLARTYTQWGWIVVSGLALGIDTAAHEGALDVRGGKTIAILGTCLERISPAVNRPLARRIIEQGGLVLSPYGPEHPFERRDFMQRDALQAALAEVVIPVQAGIGSGTLHTVHAAQQMERPVWVPKPFRQDYEAYPDTYAGLVALVQEGGVSLFSLNDRTSWPIAA